MRLGALARPGRSAAGLPPVTDPVCLLISTVAVVAGLVTAGLTSWPAQPPAAGQHPAPGPQRAQLIPPAGGRDRTAVELLASAATASQSVSYHGIEMLAWWGPGGTTAAVADVWHQAGRQPALRALAPDLEWPSGKGDASPPSAGHALAAVPSLSPRLARLLAANYRVTLGGQATVAGRPAEMVAIRRPGGGLAATFWLDRATSLPLRRATYQASGGMLSDEAFLSLGLGHAAGVSSAPQTAEAWRDTLTARQLAALRAGGWPLPAALPGHLSLLDARRGNGPAGPVVHLAYSDGLSAVSVFVQRGSLAPRPAGWSRTALGGHQVYANDPDDDSVAWSAHGFVFTVIAQAPAATLSAVVGALPHDPVPRPGLLARMRIGAHRLLEWLALQR